MGLLHNFIQKCVHVSLISFFPSVGHQVVVKNYQLWSHTILILWFISSETFGSLLNLPCALIINNLLRLLPRLDVILGGKLQCLAHVGLLINISFCPFVSRSCSNNDTWIGLVLFCFSTLRGLWKLASRFWCASVSEVWLIFYTLEVISSPWPCFTWLGSVFFPRSHMLWHLQ